MILFKGPFNKASQPVGFFRLKFLCYGFLGFTNAAGRQIDSNTPARRRIPQFNCVRTRITSGSGKRNKPIRLDEYVSHLVSFPAIWGEQY